MSPKTPSGKLPDHLVDHDLVEESDALRPLTDAFLRMIDDGIAEIFDDGIVEISSIRTVDMKEIKVTNNGLPRADRFQLSSPYEDSWLLYIFDHASAQRAVWLHKIGADGEHTLGSGYKWICSCGANAAGTGVPLTAELLRAAWSHFDAHLDPAGIPLRGLLARWDRGGREPDLDALFEDEVVRILRSERGSAAGDRLVQVEVLNVCGQCGSSFDISADDPHWKTGRGPICPNASDPG